MMDHLGQAMFSSVRMLAFTAVLAAFPLAAQAQNAGIAFGGLKQDTTLPVQVTADQLSVDQADGKATFAGNVMVVQGEMKLTAASVRVEYTADRSGIAKLYATGGVTLVNQSDAAEANEAVYTVASGEVVMTGDVLLTQGASALSGQKLVIDLKSGKGTMEGRVQTVFKPGTAKK